MKTTCHCGAEWTGLRIEHCTAKDALALPLWPATLAGAHLYAAPPQETPDGTGVSAERLPDQLRSEALAVQTLGFVAVDPDEAARGSGATPVLRMMSEVFLGGQNAEVARIVVGPVAVDVVHMLAFTRPGDEAVLVHLDIAVGSGPAESGVAASVQESPGLTGGWFLTLPERAYGLPVGATSGLPAVVATPPLSSGSWDDGLAINADDVHTLIVQCSCHETFTGTTAGDKHRTGQHHISTGPDRRRCLTAEEMRGKGMEQNARGQWTNGGTSPWAKEALPGAAHASSWEVW